VKHPLACLVATAALAVPPATTGMMPEPACTALNSQALPMLTAAFAPVAQILGPIFAAFCTPTPAPPGSTAWAPSAPWGLPS
jgi:hypothetical protein